jgi:predicted AAA+ superfamily ATPase
MNGELLNYSNVASDCGVSAKTVKEYYQILEDTLIGFTLNPWEKVKTRKLIETSKFYLFDSGVIRYLKGLDRVESKTSEFGNLFETILINEIRAYLSYKQSSIKMSFWRTTSNLEVDLILGNMQAAIEFKATDRVRKSDLIGLNAIKAEHNPKRLVLVCQEMTMREIENGITILPVRDFIEMLWRDELI